MKNIARLIKTNFPDYKKLSEEEFNRNFQVKWDKPMYQRNDTFKTLKEDYSGKELKRQMIINLFREGKYYDGFLCAMVWGNMGTYRGGQNRFEGVFDVNKRDEISSKLEKVITLLQEGKEEEAYRSLCDKTYNGIIGVGEAFFTKLLYFAGAGINTDLHPEPLIFDRNMREVYYAIVKNTGEKKRGAKYFDYCYKMEELSKLLGLQTAGYVEALLFRQDIRDFLCNLK